MYELKTQTNSDNEQPEMATFNDEGNSQNLNPDTQREFTNSDDLDMVVLCAFGGYRKTYEVTYEKHLGHEQKIVNEKWIVDPYSRAMDEAGCSYVINAIKPLISAVVVTGSLDKNTMDNLWRGKCRVLRHALLRSVYTGFKKCESKKCGQIYDIALLKCEYCGTRTYTIIKNPYHINPHRVADIMTTILTMYAVTSNAKDGFKMTALKSSFISTYINKSGGEIEKKEGIINQIKRGFK